MKNNFSQRKQSILSKEDKSSRGKWDEKIVKLCDKINSFEEYYTTSSCSGRVVIMIDQDKKESDLFLKVWHDLISLSQLREELKEIDKDSVKFKQKQDQRSSICPNLVKFKQEPCILHIDCRTIDDAKRLLDKARLAGWKKSGIISLGERIIVELNGTDKLEFPIMKSGKILVGEDFLEVIVEKSNDNLKKSWSKIGKLKNLF
ncbi:hypothetical protein GOV13_03695 [Candidatus Pacearchaeota archaeon]|nr:hypothetical protein [Candidatus Pacearchaeota archaeon]